MIERIDFRFGAAAGLPKLAMSPVPVTVFVGPNNSGKSRLLVEIEQCCRRLHPNASYVVLESLRLSPISREAMEADLARIEQTPRFGETVNPGHVIVGKLNPQNNQAIRVQLRKEDLIAEAQNPDRNGPYLAMFLGLYLLRLDGHNRLALVGQQPAGDLQTTSANHLAHLFVNNELRSKVRTIVYDAFGQYLVIDPTSIGHLRIRLSEREPADEREEKGWEQRSIEFHGKAITIDLASDGVKAFVGDRRHHSCRRS
jgi:hypothetical protein